MAASMCFGNGLSSDPSRFHDFDFSKIAFLLKWKLERFWYTNMLNLQHGSLLGTQIRAEHIRR